MKRVISRNVLLLSLVSLFTDLASELLYPVMPGYLRSIGFSVALIGFLEGVAEATAGLSKGYFGQRSDARGRRLPFVQLGYALSAVSKPLLALTTLPLGVFGARTVDRLGKGVRTGARDALLSDEATRATRARVFGFHRAMDTVGAVLGPLGALLFLSFHPNAYRSLFLLAFVPGLVAVLLTLVVRESPAKPRTDAPAVRFLDFLHYWRCAPSEYRRLVSAMLIFALVNSSDLFLLLCMRESGSGDREVIGAYCFYNLVYALAAYPLGALADRVGLRRVLVGGLLLFVFVYSGFAIAASMPAFIALLACYGLYAAATEGVVKAWITNVCEKEDAATAIGTYSAFQSIATLLASVLTGLLWSVYGPAVAFGASAMVTLIVAGYLLRLRQDN